MTSPAYWRLRLFASAATLAATVALLVVPLLLASWVAAEADGMMDSPMLGNERNAEALDIQLDSDGAVCFAVVGDVQAGAGLLPRVLRDIENRSRKADFIVQTGDFSGRPRAGHFNLALAWLAAHPPEVPFFVIPGNHDVRESARDRAVKPYFQQAFGASQYDFVYNRCLFVFLDNSMGPLLNGGQDYLQGVLAEHGAEADNIFVFLHAQPISWEGDGALDTESFYSQLFSLGKQHGIDYVFCGNWHGVHREERDGTCYVVNGRGGDYDVDAPLVPAYYTWVEVRNGAVSDSTVEVPTSLGVFAANYLGDRLVADVGYRLLSNSALCVIASATALLAMVWWIIELRRWHPVCRAGTPEPPGVGGAEVPATDRRAHLASTLRVRLWPPALREGQGSTVDSPRR